MRASTAALALLTVPALVAFVPADACAGGQQLQWGPGLGYAAGLGISGSNGGLLGLHANYGLNDTFRVYANLDYGLGVGGDAAHTPTQTGALSVGVAYTLDVVSVLPWAGLGFMARVVGSPAFTGFLPILEVRGGLDYYTNRYFALALELSYGISLASRDQVSDVFSATVGFRIVTNL